MFLLDTQISCKIKEKQISIIVTKSWKSNFKEIFNYYYDHYHYYYDYELINYNN